MKKLLFIAIIACGLTSSAQTIKPTTTIHAIKIKCWSDALKAWIYNIVTVVLPGK